MNKDETTKAQGVAYVLTFICMISLVILCFLIINQPSGMAALYIIFPIGIVAGLHIILGTGAIIAAIKAKNNLRNSWIYLYFISVLLYVLIELGFFTNLKQSFYKKADSLKYKQELLLFRAIKQKDITAVKQIIKSGVDLSHCFSHDRRFKDFSPLQYSFYYGTPEINHALLVAGADPVFSCAPAGSRISSPIVLAVRGQDVDSVSFLLAKNVPLTTPNNIYPLLPLAIAGRRTQLPPINPGRYHDKTKPDRKKTRKIITLLLAAGVPINDVYKHGTALLWAVASGDYDLVELLLKAGADPNKPENTSSYKFLPLFAAIRYQHPELAMLLLTNSPPADIQGWAGYYALITAAKFHDNQTVNFILESGFDLKSLYNEKNPNPYYRGIGEDLYDAIRKNNSSVIKALLAAGADINRPINTSGQPARPITALVADDLGKLKEIVALGGDVNAKDINGSAPLHLLAGCKYCSDPIPAMKNLLQLGADINILDKHGKTPLQRALDAKLADTQRFLRLHGAKATLAGTGP